MQENFCLNNFITEFFGKKTRFYVIFRRGAYASSKLVGKISKPIVEIC